MTVIVCTESHPSPTASLERLLPCSKTSISRHVSRHHLRASLQIQPCINDICSKYRRTMADRVTPLNQLIAETHLLNLNAVIVGILVGVLVLPPSIDVATVGDPRTLVGAEGASLIYGVSCCCCLSSSSNGCCYSQYCHYCHRCFSDCCSCRSIVS